MTTGEVVRGVLLAGDELLRVEELAVGAGADLVDHGGLEIEEDSAGDVLASTSLGEEGVESVVAATDGLVGGHLAAVELKIEAKRKRLGRIAEHTKGRAIITGRFSAPIWSPANDFKKGKKPVLDSLRLDAVLEAVELPARVTGLDTGLADVDGDNLTHF